MCAISLAVGLGLWSLPQAVPQDPSGLLPTDAAVIVRLESQDAAYDSISRLAQLFGAAQALPPRELFLSTAFSLPIDAAEIDPARPIYMATDIVMGPPMPAFLLPARDVAGLSSAVAAIGKTPVVRGDWLGFSMQPSYEPADANPRAAAMLPGVLAASIDLEEVFEMFGGLIEMGLASVEAQMGQMPAATSGGIDMQAATGLYFEGFRAFMDSAESLDLALHEDGEELALHAVYTAFEGSDLDGWGTAGALPENLPAAIDPEAQFAFLMVADWSALMARAGPLMEVLIGIYPAEAKPAFDAYWTALAEAYALLGDTAVGCGGFGEHGMHFAFYATEQGEGFIDQLAGALAGASALSGSMGITIGAPQAIEVGGLEAQQWPLEIDYQFLAQLAGQSADPQATAQLVPFFARLYGEHPALTIAEQEGRVCLSFGGLPTDLERDVARLAGGPAPAAPFLAGLRGLRGLPAAPRPLIAYHMDLGSLLQSLEPLLAAQGTPIDYPDVPLAVTTWFGIEGRRWHAGFGADMGELAAAIEAFEEQ